MSKSLKSWIKDKIINFLVNNNGLINNKINHQKEQSYRTFYKIHPTFRFGDINNIHLLGSNIELGADSYINSGRINSGIKSKIKIGKGCAIGYNVNIIAKTHDVYKLLGENAPEKDILIGDYVWIGSNVFIKEGVTIGNNAVVGANSVVTKNVPENAVVGGVPAKLLYIKEKTC